ncbi:sulfur carrier protein ThiS [Microbacterium sp. NPDC055683]
MIEITANGSTLRVASGSAVDAVVEALTGRRLDADGAPLDGAPLGVAVAVDGGVVPRAAWSSRLLVAGARVEVLTAAQGG